ncbi:MAG TPA: aldo/keto reductase, partial [Candidatus Limnocylindria bacterium]|nr:aldo/keto reductase [Candidatus Limnocylindria bacterium]
KIPQLDDNLNSLDFTIPAESRKRLDEVSALEPTHPYIFFSDTLQSMIAGGATVRPWTRANATGAPAIPAAAAKASAAEN